MVLGVKSRRAIKTTFEGAIRDEVRHWLSCSIEERSPLSS
jgi:hypothetical protein